MKLNARFALASLVLVLMAVPTLKAAELNYGFVGGVAFPTGDLKTVMDSRIGGGLGANMLVDFGEGHVLRPSLEMWAFRRSVTVTSGNLTVDGTLRLSMPSLGADYLYYLGKGTDRGLYVLGGAGVSFNKIKVSASVEGVGGEESGNSTKPYVRIGGGYQFSNHWGAEARYSATKFGDGSDAATLGMVSLAATFKF